MPCKRQIQRRLGSASRKTMTNGDGGGGRWRLPLLTSSSSPPLSCRLLVMVALLILPPPPSFAAETNEPDDGYSCRAERAAYPCRAYAFYRAALPDLLDLAAVGDLFSVSRAMIANASGFPSTSAVGRPLPPGQPLLVPLTCSCSEVAAAGGNRSYALLPYQIRAGDTFYIVSTLALQNLTTWRAVVLANPSLVPTQLQVGAVALFPVFCQCPPPPPPQRGSVAGSYFVTYVSQPSDTRSSVASLFGADPRSLIIAPNGSAGELDPFTAVLVPVSRLPVLQLPSGQHPLPPPPSSCQSERNNKRGAVVGLGFGMGFVGLMLLAAMLWWGWKEEEKKKKKERGAGMQQMMAVSGGGDLMAEIVECLDRYRVFEVEELREATAGFDEGCRVGGSVYRGCIQGETYAVKKLRWDACQQLKILQKVNHTNLVKLEGFSVDPENAACYLVYEFVENGSLRSWLHGGKLDWRTRLRIALDVANGLQYIHEHTWPRLVAHRDIKASNILLDNQMRAKISDFGLTRSGSNAMTTRFVGSPGYVAPEYIEGGLVSTKMDVFSYGVVLLELVSGREAVNKEGEALWVQVERALQGNEDRRRDGEEQQLQEWVDEELVKLHVPMDGVINVMAIARACLRRDPSARPSMVDVAYSLSKTDDLYVDFSGDGLPIADTSVVAR